MAERSSASRIAVILLCAALTVALMLSHAAMDSQVFGFLGLRYVDPGLGWTLFSFATATVPGLWLPMRADRPSQVAYWILYCTVIVPTMFMPFRVLDVDPGRIAVFTSLVLLSFYGLSLATVLPLVKVKRPDWPPVSFGTVAGAVLLGMTLAVWYYGGFRMDLGLTEIYDRRRAAREIVGQQSFAAYLKGNVASSFQPYAFALGLALRSWWLIGASVFAGLVVFSLEGSKTSALVPFFLVAMLPLLTRYRPQFGMLFPAACVALVAAAYFTFEATRLFHVPTLTTWRLFQVKGLLSSYYFEFFSTHQPTLLGDGILQPFVGRTYELATPRLIGDVYFGSDETNSNANIWASAFGDFGLVGIPLASLVAGVVFRILDSLSANRGFLVPAFMAAFIGMKWSDTAIDTAMLSHGVLATLIVLYLMPSLERAGSAKRAQTAAQPT